MIVPKLTPEQPLPVMNFWVPEVVLPAFIFFRKMYTGSTNSGTQKFYYRKWLFRRQTKIVMGSRRDADIVQKFRTRTQKFKTRITILHEDEMPTKTGGGMPEDWSQNAGDFDSRWTARRAEVSFSDCVSR